MQELNKGNFMGGFHRAYLKYVETNNLQTAEFFHMPSYSGGFLIFDTRLFSSKSYRHFVDFVDDTGLIFSLRLSDQSVFAYATALLTFGCYTHHFSGFGFNHIDGWGGNQVFTDASHPFWHSNQEDPFCLAVASNDTTTTYETLQLEYFWKSQVEVRNKNLMLSKAIVSEENGNWFWSFLNRIIKSNCSNRLSSVLVWSYVL